MSYIEELYNIYLKHPVICTDTRSIEKNSIFFALKGQNFNANLFALQALEAGAAYAVVDDASLVPNEHFIFVPDVLSALQSLALHHRRFFKIPFIAITGSNGKTTTKELLHATLSARYKVLATKGNFNNHIGVPMTLLRLKAEHELAIIEMGANHIGEISFLCSLAEPDFGIITNIGKAHLKGFGSLEGVVQAKTELYKYIGAKGGTLFVNESDELLVQESSGFNRIFYGSDATYEMSGEGKIQLKLTTDFNQKTIRTELFGSYNFSNLMCAFSVGKHFNVPVDGMLKAIEQYKPQNNRSQIISTSANTVVLDAYNANPTSMSLAVQSFHDMPGKNKIVVLGDMLELGDHQESEHRRIVELLNQLRFKDVYLVGPVFSSLNQSSFRVFPNVDVFTHFLDGLPLEGCQILVKGSRGIQLEKVLDYIP